jgi:tetratricopeptide (TPR) repeat protein
VRFLGVVIVLLVAGVGRAAHAQDEADRAWRAGDVAKARELYEARLAADSTDDRALHRVALMDAWEHRYDRSLRLFGQLLALGPNLEAEVDRARVVAWRGAPLDAVTMLDSLLGRAPGYIPALEARAEFLAWAGESDAAVTSYAQLAEILPENRNVRSARARLLSWASRLDESIALYDSLVRTDPGDREARLGLARALGWAGRTDSAAAVYDGMLADDSTDVEALVGMAQTRSWAGRLRAAELLWRQVLARDSLHVPALVGLAQTLRWQGRDAAADEVLRRAEARDAMNQEVRTQRRWLNGALRPRATSTVTYESDSDGSGIFTVFARAGYRVRPRVDLRPYGYLRWLGFESGAVNLDQRAWGGALEVRTEVDPGWVFGASLGASGSDADTVGTQIRWGATASSPGWWRVVTTLGVSREPLDATVQLVRNGVSVMQGGIDLRTMLAGGWTATGAFSLAEFSGSESNVRTAGALGASRRVLRVFTIGGNARAYGFSKDLTDGYFDPDFYLLAETPVRWEQEFGRWIPSAEVAPGLQKISGADLSAAIRVAGGLRYAVMPGREIALNAGYSTLGLSLFAEGGGGYKYRYVSLSGGWWF